MATKIAAAALQYSKWLSRFICWVWAIYRISVLAAAAIVPEAAEALVNSLAGIDTIMIINEGTYLINSLGEKYIYSDKFVLQWLNKGGFKSLISRIATAKHAAKEAEEEIEEDEEEVENG